MTRCGGITASPRERANGISLFRSDCLRLIGRDAGCLIRHDVPSTVDGEIDGEIRALRAGFESDLATVLGFNYAARDIQAEAGAAADRFGGKEGLEDVLLIFFGDARSVIG